MSTASKFEVPSTSKFPLKSALPARVRLDAMSTAPSISTASKFVVPSMSILPDISRVAAVTCPAKVALPLLKMVAFSPIGVSAPRVLTPAISIPTLCKLDVPVFTVVSSIVTVPLPTDMMPVTRIPPRTITSVRPTPTVSRELLTSRVPATVAFSSTVSVSIFAVPSMNKSCHSKPEAPKSLAPSVLGVKSLSKRPVAVIVSLVASPKSTLPFADRVVKAPVLGEEAPIVVLLIAAPSTVPPLISAVSATNESMFAVPSRYKSLNSKPEAPKSRALSVLGTISLSKRPVAVIVSLVAFPKSVSPVTTTLVVVRIDPSNVRFPLSSSSPEVPAITTLLSVRSPIFAVSASSASMFAVPSMKMLFHSLVAEPKLYVPSSSGIICESTSPPKTILSVFASPKVSVPPLKVVVPVTSRLLYI